MKLSTETDRSRWIGWVLTLRLPLDVSAKRWREVRTDPQNRYLFGICYPPIAEAMGYTVDDLHEWVCGTFFGWVDRKVPKTPRNPKGWESVPFRTTTKDENGKRDVIPKERFSLLLETVVFPAAARSEAFIAKKYEEDA